MKETYGNESSDSSDEDYEDGPLPKVRKFKDAKGAMASPSSTPTDIKCQSGKQKGSGHTSDSGLSEKLKVGGAGTSESHSSGKRKTYGEVATKVFVGFNLVNCLHNFISVYSFSDILLSNNNNNNNIPLEICQWG